MKNSHGFVMTFPHFWYYREKIGTRAAFQIFLDYNTRHLHESGVSNSNRIIFYGAIKSNLMNNSQGSSITVSLFGILGLKIKIQAVFQIVCYIVQAICMNPG